MPQKFSSDIFQQIDTIFKMLNVENCPALGRGVSRAGEQYTGRWSCLVWPLNALHDTWRLCFRTPHKALKCHFRRLKWRPATPTAQQWHGEGAASRACLTLQSCSSSPCFPALLSLSLAHIVPEQTKQPTASTMATN